MAAAYKAKILTKIISLCHTKKYSPRISSILDDMEHSTRVEQEKKSGKYLLKFANTFRIVMNKSQQNVMTIWNPCLAEMQSSCINSIITFATTANIIESSASVFATFYI
jgi:hypothetical protein